MSVVFSGVATNKDIDDNDPAVFSGTIESIAKSGTHKLTHTPATASGAIMTGTMRIAEAALSSAAMTGVSHIVAGFDYLKITGTQNSAQQFVTESRLDMTNTGTTTSVGLLKPTVGTIDGTITALKYIDIENDLSGISGTVTTAYAMWSPDTDKRVLVKGGIITDTITPGGDVTLDDSYSGKAVYFLTGATQTVTVPDSLSAGFWCEVIQGDANQITCAGSGTLTVFGSNGAKTRTTSSVISIRVINANAAYIGGDAAV